MNTDIISMLTLSHLQTFGRVWANVPIHLKNSDSEDNAEVIIENVKVNFWTLLLCFQLFMFYFITNVYYHIKHRLQVLFDEHQSMFFSSCVSIFWNFDSNPVLIRAGTAAASSRSVTTSLVARSYLATSIVTRRDLGR